MEISFFIDPGLKGVLAGVFIGTLGYFKNTTSKADPSDDIITKLTHAPVNWSMYGSTVFITTILSMAAFLMIALGVPTEYLLALVPLAMRESLNDAIALGNNVLKKPVVK